MDFLQTFDPTSLLPTACIDFVLEKEYLDLADGATFNAGYGRVLLAGADACQQELLQAI